MRCPSSAAVCSTGSCRKLVDLSIEPRPVFTNQGTMAQPESNSPAKYAGEISSRGQSGFHTQMPFYLSDSELVASL